MAGPYGVLLAGPAVTTTKVEEDVDGRPPWGMLAAGLATATTKVEEDLDGASPGGATGGSGHDHHLVSEDINGGLPGGCYWWIRQWQPLSQ
jgi:hypothetical protein